MRQADLHMHSTYSDGLLTPEQLVQHCARQGLSMCCLTDHDTIGGFTEFQAACAALGITTFSGIELSTTYGDAGFHVLGYGFDSKSTNLQAHLDQTSANRENRIMQILEKLRELGIDLSTEDLAARSEDARFGRPQIADALVAGGFVADFRAAFEQYLGPRGLAYVPYEKIQTDAAIRLIKSVGGQAVLAHPGLQNRDDLLPDLVQAGLDGLEVIHPEHSPDTVIHYEQMAAANQLYITGGSDYHARPQDEGFLGKYGIPESRLEPLLAKLYD